MEVPFVSSGAMSRAHYALVRKVELATSPQAADAILLAEIEAIHYRLIHSTLTQKQVKECLILLLYCATAMAPGAILDTSFALPHAISLAEAGKTVQDKKIGYLFCVETMSKHHELQLMLVNTLRKDLHSDEVPRIALALDLLIQLPPEDVIPAIQDRLFELLSHTSPLIRRRVLFAYHSLAQYDKGILQYIVDKTRKRLDDHDHAVISAALVLCIELHSNNLLPDTTYHAALVRLIKSVWKHVSPHHKSSWLFLRALQALRTSRTLSSDDFELVHEIIRSKPRTIPLANAIIYECFSILSICSNIDTSKSSMMGRAFIDCIRDRLTSDDMNDIYTFVKCLECLEPTYWAGTSPDTPAVLEAWEVERIMTLLGCNDQLIRKKVLCILLKVDRNIVESYFTQISASNFAAILQDGSGDLKKALEVIEVLSGDDGEAYAQQIVHMFTSVSDNPHRKNHVYEGAIEEVLNYIRNAAVEFRSGCLGVLFALLAGHERAFDSSLATILAALVCEYLDSCPLSPEDMLRGLATLLPSHGAAIQDACLLAMLRVAAGCQSIPDEALGVVRKLQETAGRYIKRRSTQFLELSQSLQNLKDIVAHTKSNSLPDFVIALETYQAKERAPTGNSISRTSSSSALSSGDRPSSRASSMAGSKLRYTAYEAPRPTPKLRRRASSSSSLSNRSDASCASEELARTFTPGELALATGRLDLHDIGKSPISSPPALPSVQIMDEDELANQTDLITLESPFFSEPQTSISSLVEPDFEAWWNSLASSSSRGWYGGPLDAVVRKLQGLQKKLKVTPADQPPFAGDLKVIVSSSSTPSEQNSALLRLREGEEDSCLWHLRCADADLRGSIRALLRDA